MPSLVALIPARAGSKRIPGKNTKLLAGHPLLAYTIAAAQLSGIFRRIYLCSDDPKVNDYETHLVALMPREPVADDQPDIVWVRDALMNVPDYDAFAILRPTSPFRTADTIRRAWAQFQAHPCDSLRAVQRVTEHPAKMWSIDKDGSLVALLPYRHPDGTPWHSSPTQTLRPFYVQNASLEIAWTKTVTEMGTISGDRIRPFFTEGLEGFDLNTPEDWAEAERLIAAGATLPAIEVSA